MTRGSPAEVMEPKPAEPRTVFGAPSGGVLVRLKNSARNSRFRTSPKYVRLIRATSAFRYCGPRTGLRELLPIVNCDAVVKSDVLKNRVVVRSEADKFGSATTFGR